jgi:hypothetical protein
MASLSTVIVTATATGVVIPSVPVNAGTMTVDEIAGP